MTKTLILWQRLDLRGHEFSTLEHRGNGWLLEGTALILNNALPCRLSYLIECDEQWQTKSVGIVGEIGERAVNIDLTRSSASVWHANGAHIPEVDGCMDIDLGFSPSTNLIPIRRLSLAIGDRAEVRAAWMRFPELTMEPLDQVYTRIGANRYRYESAGGAFRAELTTNEDGFVLEYPDYWRAESVTRIA